jgi:hypothetical protein
MVPIAICANSLAADPVIYRAFNRRAPDQLNHAHRTIAVFSYQNADSTKYWPLSDRTSSFCHKTVLSPVIIENEALH